MSLTFEFTPAVPQPDQHYAASPKDLERAMRRMLVAANTTTTVLVLEPQKTSDWTICPYPQHERLAIAHTATQDTFERCQRIVQGTTDPRYRHCHFVHMNVTRPEGATTDDLLAAIRRFSDAFDTSRVTPTLMTYTDDPCDLMGLTICYVSEDTSPISLETLTMSVTVDTVDAPATSDAASEPEPASEPASEQDPKPDSEPVSKPEPAKREKLSNALRFTILLRDHFTCQYCGRTVGLDGSTLEIDHIQPVSLGGATVAENLVCACRRCNLGKGDTLLLNRAGRPATYTDFVKHTL